jgi:hypothetical protein
MIKKEIEGKELKQVLHFRFSFEPRFSEVDKSLFLAPPSVLRHVMYTIVDRYDNERETWSKSRANTKLFEKMKNLMSAGKKCPPPPR